MSLLRSVLRETVGIQLPHAQQHVAAFMGVHHHAVLYTVFDDEADDLRIGQFAIFVVYACPLSPPLPAGAFVPTARDQSVALRSLRGRVPAGVPAFRAAQGCEHRDVGRSLWHHVHSRDAPAERGTPTRADRLVR